MKIWLIQPVNASNPAAAVKPAYVHAPSEPHAREWAHRNGLRVEEIREVQPSSVPHDVTPHSCRPATDHAEQPLEIIARSSLIRAPVFTIAIGVAIGLLLAAFVLLLLGIGFR